MLTKLSKQIEHIIVESGIYQNILPDSLFNKIKTCENRYKI
jgi:hypothetical protein